MSDSLPIIWTTISAPMVWGTCIAPPYQWGVEISIHTGIEQARRNEGEEIEP